MNENLQNNENINIKASIKLTVITIFLIIICIYTYIQEHKNEIIEQHVYMENGIKYRYTLEKLNE